MKTSLRGAIEIASHEGIVLSPYRDSKGIWTVFVGHTAGAGPPDPERMLKGETRDIAEAMTVFRRDLKRFEDRVNSAVKVPLEQHEFDALVSFDFNTGGIHRAKLTKALNRGDRAGAAARFMGWRKPKEIIPRRKKEQRLFRDGVYSANGKATVYKANYAGKVLWKSGQKVNIAELLARKSPEKPAQPVSPPSTGYGPPKFKRPSTGFPAWIWTLVFLAAVVGGFLLAK